MLREEAINWLNTLYMRADITDEYGDMEDMQPYEEAVNMAIKALEQEPKPCDTCRHYENGCHWLPSVAPLEQEPKSSIKALGDEMRICQKSITDEKVLIGFNMAVAICNKHLAESEG